jgi:hypothetical protein
MASFLFCFLMHLLRPLAGVSVVIVEQFEWIAYGSERATAGAREEAPGQRHSADFCVLAPLIRKN